MLSSSKTGYDYTVEDFANAIVRFENGFALQVEASFNLNIDRDTGSIELFGTKAGIKAIDDKVEMYTDLSGMFVKVAPYSVLGCDTNAFRGEIAGFVDAAMNGAPCRATAEDGIWLMKILDAIYASAQTGKSVDITPIA